MSAKVTLPVMLSLVAMPPVVSDVSVSDQVVSML